MWTQLKVVAVYCGSQLFNSSQLAYALILLRWLKQKGFTRLQPCLLDKQTKSLSEKFQSSTSLVWKEKVLKVGGERKKALQAAFCVWIYQFLHNWNGDRCCVLRGKKKKKSFSVALIPSTHLLSALGVSCHRCRPSSPAASYSSGSSEEEEEEEEKIASA